MTQPQLSLPHLARAAQPSQAAPLLILLHGYGSNERDLFGLAPYIDPRYTVLSVRAPIALGQGAYAWFPLDWRADGVHFSAEDVQTARQRVIQLVAEAQAAYQPEGGPVYLLGFSQGAIMSAATLLARPDMLAGAALMSGSATPDMAPADTAALAHRPVLIVHGVYDDVLPIRHGRQSREVFAALPVDLAYHEFPMGHEVSAASLDAVVGWLRARLA